MVQSMAASDNYERVLLPFFTPHIVPQELKKSICKIGVSIQVVCLSVCLLINPDSAKRILTLLRQLAVQNRPAVLQPSFGGWLFSSKCIETYCVRSRSEGLPGFCPPGCLAVSKSTSNFSFLRELFPLFRQPIIIKIYCLKSFQQSLTNLLSVGVAIFPFVNKRWHFRNTLTLNKFLSTKLKKKENT